LLDRLLRAVAADKSRDLAVRSVRIAFLLGTGAVLQFLLNWQIARRFGAHQTGLFFLAFTLLTVLSVLGRFGLDTAVVRLAARLFAEGDVGGVRGVRRTAVLLSLGVSALLAAALYAASGALASSVFKDRGLVPHLRIVAVAIPFLSLAFLNSELLRALRRVELSVFLKQILMYLVANLLLALSLARSTAAATAIFALSVLVGAAAGEALLRLRLRRESRRSAAGSVAPYPLRSLLALSSPLLAVALSTLVLQWTDTLLLGVLADARAVGVYNVAMRVAQLLTFVLVSMNTLIAPQFSVLFQAGRLEELADLFRRATVAMLALTSPPLVLLLLFPRQVLGLFGAEFTAGAGVLIVLAIGQFVNAVTGPVGFLLTMTRYERIFAATAAGTAGLDIALNALLIPRHGMLGAAIATSVSLIVMNLALTWQIWRKFGLLPAVLDFGWRRRRQAP
jgi:O-antigen/teichoic acid export membrane protein